MEEVENKIKERRWRYWKGAKGKYFLYSFVRVQFQGSRSLTRHTDAEKDS